MRFAKIALLFVPLVVAGCGGDDFQGCSADIATEPVAAYAGSYTATFTPTEATAAVETFALSVAEDGTVTGNVTVGDTVEELSSSSKAGKLRNGCTIKGTSFELTVVNPNKTTDFFRATRSGRGSLVGTYGATRIGDAANVTGTLVVVKAVTNR